MLTTAEGISIQIEALNDPYDPIALLSLSCRKIMVYHVLLFQMLIQVPSFFCKKQSNGGRFLKCNKKIVPTICVDIY